MRDHFLDGHELDWSRSSSPRGRYYYEFTWWYVGYEILIPFVLFICVLIAFWSDIFTSAFFIIWTPTKIFRIIRTKSELVSAAQQQYFAPPTTLPKWVLALIGRLEIGCCYCNRCMLLLTHTAAKSIINIPIRMWIMVRSMTNESAQSDLFRFSHILSI